MRRCFGNPCPDKHTIVFIHRQFLGVDEFVFHRVKEVVIKLEAHLQSAIRDTVLLLEQCAYLGEDVIEGHPCPSVVELCLSVRTYNDTNWLRRKERLWQGTPRMRSGCGWLRNRIVLGDCLFL